jgi:sugar phosphate isomerase/epimerase
MEIIVSKQALCMRCTREPVRIARSHSAPNDAVTKEHPTVGNAHRIRRGVSLYSFQDEYFLRTLTVEDMIRECAAMGAYGIEIIPEQSIPGYPRLTEEFVRDWFDWMKEYGTTPVATDLFIDTKRHPGRRMTTAEGVESFKQDIDIAVRLGARCIRAIINTPPEVMEGVASYAESRNVRLLLEVHAPFNFEHPWVLRHLEVMDRLESPALGFMPDLGIFVERFPRIVADRALRDGARPEIVDLIVDTYDSHGNTHGLMDTMEYMDGSPVEVGLARQAGFFTWNDPEILLSQMHRIHHIQAKFYEMTDAGKEYSIPYERIVPVLIDAGYEGYLSSEYEGNRHIEDAYQVDSVDQVRRHQSMLAELLQED